MESLQSDPLHSGWVKGWMVLKVKQQIPGDFVSFHAHATQAQAEAQRRGTGHQVFHGSHRIGSEDFIVD